MASNGLNKALDHLRRALPPPDESGLTDDQLLKRFLAERDEIAFATLVRRHGKMVLGLCRRVLGNVHDAEDAFQATFLVLAQKAQSVINHEAVGGWLYTVACRIALEIRAANARRRVRERTVMDVPHPLVPPAESRDWLPLFDRELSRLPEKYRTAIVLCELEGRTRKEVALQLRLPEGTLSSRIATAKRMLAKRLARHGLTISAAALVTMLSEAGASAHVSVSMIWSTAHAATLVAAGQLAALTTPAAALTKGALKAMFIAKLKTASATFAAVAVIGMCSMVWSAGGGSGAAQAGPVQGQVSELETLRKENELLNVNLRVTLETIRALEKELAGLKQTAAVKDGAVDIAFAQEHLSLQSSPRSAQLRVTVPSKLANVQLELDGNKPFAETDVEAALKVLQTAKDKTDRQHALDLLEQATKKLREQLK
jgi:RNA polymerase sigma factor (sigma-70 family)